MPLDFLSEDRIEHVTIGLLHVRFSVISLFSLVVFDGVAYHQKSHEKDTCGQL